MRMVFLLMALGLCTLWGEERTMQLYKEGNYAESLTLCLKLLEQPELPTAELHSIFDTAIQNLNNLQRVAEFDALCAQILKVYPERWEIYSLLAAALQRTAHSGQLIDAEFRRGYHRRSRGLYVDSSERDRLQALQWYARGKELLEADRSASPSERCYFYVGFGEALLGSGVVDAWRLLHRSDWTVLPDYTDVSETHPLNAGGAPVDAAGDPLFFAVPDSFAGARNDGERWRWLWTTAAGQDANATNTVAVKMAYYCQQLYGVQTLFSRPGLGGGDTESIRSWLETLPELGENETVASLPTGIRRFRLPDEFNYLRLFRAQGLLAPLAEVYENRRQYPQALACWQTLAQRKDDHAVRRAARISENRGEFLPGQPQRYGQPIEAMFRYRNASRVAFTLHRVDFAALLREARQQVFSGESHGYLALQNLGDYLLGDGKKFVGAVVARWELPLQPPAGHVATTVTVKVPVSAPGAYWLLAKLPDGNVSRIPLIVDQCRLLSRQLRGEMLWHLLREEDGHGVVGARLELLAWRQQWDRKKRQNTLLHHTFSGTTDADGLFYLSDKTLFDSESWQFLGMAEGPDGVISCLYPAGFALNPARNADGEDEESGRNRGIVISDRPVYRPGERVHFKIWRQRIAYTDGVVNPYAQAPTGFVILDPTGEKIYSSEQMLQEQPTLGDVLRTDEFGGIAGSFQLPTGARLGVYRLNSEVVSYSFRVEEYRNPEFEVKVRLPDVPLRLGDSFPIEIRGSYYFGAPVASGRVSVKVYRKDHVPRLWPICRWDWLYGNGYAWLGADYPWFPGWQAWGTPAPRRSSDGLWWWPQNPPELISEREGELDASGTFTLTIDTAPALKTYGDRDHSYEVRAEVRDASRRVIAGTGELLAVRKPFRATAWTDGGFYRTGDSVLARLQIVYPDGRPAVGVPLTLKLLRCRYPGQGEIVETPVQEWQLQSDAEGNALQPFTAAKSGQFRLSWSFADGARLQESACLVNVYGDAGGAEDYRYNGLELIPERSTYQPGEEVRLRINVSRPGALVLLFVRTVNGIGRRPQVLRLNGLSHEVTIPVDASDYPNFFIEAATLWQGEWHSVLREIAVPPAPKVLQVEVTPAAVQQRPGEMARVRLQVSDADGKPYAGSLVGAVYDKSIEAIASSSIADILPAFWNWKRHSHAPWQLMSWYLSNTLKPKDIPFENLGVSEFFDDSPPLSQVGYKHRGGPVLFAAAPARAEMAMMKMGEAVADVASAPGGGEAETDVTVRSNFVDTAYWSTALRTDQTGAQTIEFPWPDALTTWKIRVWAKGIDGEVGYGEAEVCISKEVMLRLQAPRFLVERDEAVLSAVLHNFRAEALTAPVRLELEGEALALMPGEKGERSVTVPAGGELRVDWKVCALQAGTTPICMKILAGADSDAMQISLPVHVYGAPIMQAWSAMLNKDEKSAEWTFTLPEEIRSGSQQLQVNCSPSLAWAMLDALPYLLDYPYGCTEQTLNRFLPAVITRGTLSRLGVSLEEIEGQRSRLNAQSLPGSALPWIAHPAGKTVFDSAEMAKIVQTGISDLEKMQCADGGWGWFSGYGETSSPYFTALVLHGLHLAQRENLPVVKNVIERGLKWLTEWQRGEIEKLDNAGKMLPVDPRRGRTEALDALVFQVLAEYDAMSPAMADYLFRDRVGLSLYAKALFALGLPAADPRVPQLVRNLQQFLQTDAENQTAFLDDDNRGYWWNWYGDNLETQVAFLRLRLRTGDPERIAPRLVKYLLNNRRHGGSWRSTRTTALVIEAFAEYIRFSGEGSAEVQAEVLLNGKPLWQLDINRDNLLTATTGWRLEAAELPAGTHTLTIRKRGSGPLYCNAYLDYFSREENIAPAGLEIKIERRLYRLSEEISTVATIGSDGQPIGKQVVNLKRSPLSADTLLRSGDRVEIELLIESKNDYEHILIEDFKAAGLEAEELRSGYRYGSLGAYIEYRTDRVALFLSELPRGRHALRYTLRAETPGRFVALPTQASGFYAPELRGNSELHRINVSE